MGEISNVFTTVINDNFGCWTSLFMSFWHVVIPLWRDLIIHDIVLCILNFSWLTSDKDFQQNNSLHCKCFFPSTWQDDPVLFCELPASLEVHMIEIESSIC